MNQQMSGDAAGFRVRRQSTMAATMAALTNGAIEEQNRMKRPKRPCQGSICGGKTNLHHNDPHDMCFRCRGAYHDLTECPLCQLVPASTRSTWVTRCQYWRNNMDPNGPPPHSKPSEIEAKKKRLENASSNDIEKYKPCSEHDENDSSKCDVPLNSDFNPVITSYGSAAGMFGVPYNAEAKDLESTPGRLTDAPPALTPEKLPPIVVAPTDGGESTNDDRQGAESPCLVWSQNESAINRNAETQQFLPMPHTIWNEPRACVDNSSYFTLMNEIMKAEPELVQQGGIISKIPKIKYTAITGPKPKPSAFPLDETIQELIDERQNQFLSQKRCNKALSAVRSRFKVVDGHMKQFAKPKENAILHLISKNKSHKKHTLTHDINKTTETQYACAQTGICLSNHLLILSQYGLSKLRQVDLEEVCETLKAIQKASEDLLSTSLATWASTLVSHRHVVMSSLQCPQEAKNELLHTPMSKEGFLFDDANSIIAKHSQSREDSQCLAKRKRGSESQSGYDGKKSRFSGTVKQGQHSPRSDQALDDVDKDPDVIELILADGCSSNHGSP